MPKEAKLSFEEKLKLVLACISKEIGVCEAARIAQVNHSAVRSWIKGYEAEGVEWLLPHAKNRAYSTELKTEAVLAYLSGKTSLLEICKEYKIRSTTQLRNWITIVTTNLPFSQWTDLFENTTMVAAVIDRLTFRSHVLDMNGDFYRLRATMQRQQ